MKAVILAGGYGTRISEESQIRPKPMVELGGKPILWHIMKLYSHYGINDFVIACGYKSQIIKDYFANYTLYNSDVSFDMQNKSMQIHKNDAEDWKVTLVETGEGSLTGGRILRIKDYVGDEAFCMTYGDGLSDANIANVIDFHKKEGKLATVLAVQPPGRFGIFTMTKGSNVVEHFREKPQENENWINGGFMILEPKVFDYIEGDKTTFEKEPMEQLAKEGQLAAFRHTGFWQPMDTLRDKMVLEEIWQSGKAPWYVWKK
ncbi:MAG: glucose-1-phosphate cytidylyltransferase [Patescibacteria group bacterium]